MTYYTSSDEQLGRDVKAFAEPSNVLDGQIAPSLQDFRNDAGRSEDVHEVLLPEVARPHELGQTLNRRGSLQSIVLLLEILDQHGQQPRQLFLGRRGVGLRVKGLKRPD